MKSTTSISLALVAIISAFTFSTPSQATMTPYMESSLIEVCKAAKSNQMHRFNKTKKSFNLTSKKIALKVSCNGQSIIDFAESYGSFKTAEHLSKRMGKVSITDIAKAKKINVNFEG